MGLWDNIVKGLKARRGEFTGTSGNEYAIQKRLDENKSVNISNPTSQRTFHRDNTTGTLLDQQIDVGDTTAQNIGSELGEISSTAISNARYDPSDDSLNITYQGGNKEYKFKAGGPIGVEEWVDAPSKGRITQEWRTTHRYPGY